MLTDAELAALLANTGIDRSPQSETNSAMTRIALLIVHGFALASIIGLVRLLY